MKVEAKDWVHVVEGAKRDEAKEVLRGKQSSWRNLENVHLVRNEAAKRVVNENRIHEK